MAAAEHTPLHQDPLGHGTGTKVLLLSAANSIHTVRWANAFAQRGISVDMVTQHATLSTLSSAVRVHRLPHFMGLGYVINGPRFRKLVQELRPDVVNAHYATGYGTIARWSGKVPLVLNVWGSDVYTFPAKSVFHRWWLRRNLRRADRIVSTSEAMAHHTKSVCPGLSTIAIVPFGVDTELFRPTGKSTNGPWVVGTVKTLAPTYGIDILLRAFALVPKLIEARELRLRIVGSGPQQRELCALSESLGVADRVDFIGAVPHDRVPAELGRMDVFVALSRSESFGVAVIEASACGLPVVVSDVGGLPEVVVHGVGGTGVIVPANDIEAAASAIKALLADLEMREAMGKTGRDHIMRAFGWSQCVDKLLAVYQDAMEHAER